MFDITDARCNHEVHKAYLFSKIISKEQMLDDLGDERGRKNLNEEALDHIALTVQMAVYLSLRHTAR